MKYDDINFEAELSNMTSEEFQALDNLDENLKASSSRITKADKFNRLQGAMGSSIAKKLNDPLYSKMIKAKQLYMKCKMMLQKKYAAKAKQAAKLAAR